MIFFHLYTLETKSLLSVLNDNIKFEQNRVLEKEEGYEETEYRHNSEFCSGVGKSKSPSFRSRSSAHPTPSCCLSVQ
jgi:hypothetical protein